MDVIELFFVGLISGSIILMVLALFYGIKYFEIRKSIIQLKKKKIKNKKKKIRLKKFRIRLEKKQKKKFKYFSIYLIISFMMLGGYFLLKNYTSKHLSKEDRSIVIEAYFLVEDYERELINARNSNGSEEDVQEKLSGISSRMASYMVETPSERISVEGNRILNKYYKSISELGINTVNLNKQFYGRPEFVDEYMDNISSIKQIEKNLFAFFNIEKSRIKEK